MSRPRLPGARRGLAVSAGGLDEDALWSPLLEDSVRRGAAGLAAERLEGGNVRVRYVS